MSRVHFLTADQVVEMHDVLLDQWGGEAGGGHRGPRYYEGADAAVQAVKNSYYDSAEELAAAYAVYIVQGYVFLDGNKRTATAAMLVFLEANGIRVKVPPAEIVATMIELQRRAESGEDTGRLVKWLAEFLTSRRSAPASRSSRRGPRS